MKSKKMDGEVSLSEFIEVKGWKASGNKLSDQKLLDVKEKDEETGLKPETSQPKDAKYHVGDSIDFDFEANGQGKLFD